MVRIARHETIEHRTGYQEDSRDEAIIVAGCNTDALGKLRVPASCRCVADKCAMWRWGEKAPEPRDTKILCWADEDEPVTEPARPYVVPESAIWVPYTAAGENWDGGYWIEAEDVVDAENAKAAAARRGYCGLAGSPCA